MTNVISFPREVLSNGLAQLDLSERLFLWGFRAMAQHHRCGCPVGDEIRTVYGRYQIDDIVGSLDAMIEAFASNAHTAIEIHSPNCPCVSESEKILLQAMAAAQSSDLNGARRAFQRWLPELAADWIVGPACGIAKTFQTAGMTLPLRTIEAPDMHETTATPSFANVSRALH
jgi:hypothetical protein